MIFLQMKQKFEEILVRFYRQLLKLLWTEHMSYDDVLKKLRTKISGTRIEMRAWRMEHSQDILNKREAWVNSDLLTK